MLGVKTKMRPSELEAFNYYYSTRSIKETASLCNKSEVTIRTYAKKYNFELLAKKIESEEAIRKALNSDTTLDELNLIQKEIVRSLYIETLIKVNKGEIKVTSVNDLSKVATMLKDLETMMKDSESTCDTESSIEVSLTVKGE